MKNIWKKIKKNYKWIILGVVVIIITILSLFIYKNLFKENDSDRLEGIENYNLSKKEISAVKEKINELEKVDSIDIYPNYKIIKIFVVLSEDVDFDDVKKVSNELVEEFSEDNLSFYDLEIFVDSNNEESEIYPKIGYKYKTNLEFTWNR